MSRVESWRTEHLLQVMVEHVHSHAFCIRLQRIKYTQQAQYSDQLTNTMFPISDHPIHNAQLFISSTKITALLIRMDLLHVTLLHVFHECVSWCSV